MVPQWVEMLDGIFCLKLHIQLSITSLRLWKYRKNKQKYKPFWKPNKNNICCQVDEKGSFAL